MLFGPVLMTGLLAAGAPGTPTATPSQNAIITVAPVAGTPAGLQPGDPAPDFGYRSVDDMWLNLHNILEQGDVVLVFGAGERELLELDRSRAALVRSGVLPVAVVERRDGDVRAMVRRLDLGYSLLSDPQASIGDEFGVRDPASRHAVPSWFVIDRTGRIRQSGRDPDAIADWSRIATAALGRSEVQTTSTR